MKKHFFYIAITILMTSGCAQTTKMMSEPFNAVGKMFTTIGDGINQTDKIPFVPTAGNIPHIKELNDDLKEEYKKTAVFVKEGDEVYSKLGLGISLRSIDNTQLFKVFRTNIEKWSNYRYYWFIDNTINDAAMACPGGVIKINDFILQQYTLNQQYFIVLHECGHHVLGHLDNALNLMYNGRYFDNPHFEIEADRYATEVLRNVNWPITMIELTAYQLFMENLENVRGYPGMIERYDAVKDVLYRMDK